MVKNKKLVNDGRFEIQVDELVHRPRSGAAVIALQSEFYRAAAATDANHQPQRISAPG